MNLFIVCWEMITDGEMIIDGGMIMDDFREVTSEDDVEEGAKVSKLHL